MPSKPLRRSFIAATPAFAAGQDTPRAFLERCLEQIDAREKDVLAFVETAIPTARSGADAATERWRENRQLSSIDGMPIGIKDVIETADMATGKGSPLFTGWRSGWDSASVKALREAGVAAWPKAMEQARQSLVQLGAGRARRLPVWLLDLDLALKGDASRGLRARLALERLFCKMARRAEPAGSGTDESPRRRGPRPAGARS